MNAEPSPLKTTPVLAGLCGMLALVLAAEYALGLYGHEPRVPEPPPSAPREQPAEVPPFGPESFSLPEISHYGDMLERPLFVPGRKTTGTAPAPAPAPAPATQADFTLVGIILSEGAHIALLQEADGKMHRVQKGQAIQGWQVTEVLPGSVQLTHDGRSTRLFLRKESSLPKVAPSGRNDSPPVRQPLRRPSSQRE